MYITIIRLIVNTHETFSCYNVYFVYIYIYIYYIYILYIYIYIYIYKVLYTNVERLYAVYEQIN